MDALRRIFNFLWERYYLLTALFLFLSYPSFEFILFRAFPLFAWFALVPLFMALREKPLSEVYYASYFAGFFGNLMVYSWIRHFGASMEGGGVIVLLFLIPTLTFFFAMKVFLAEFLSRRFPAFRVLVYPAAWVSIDFIQSIGHLAFPWPYLGYTQYPFTPMIQMASITGVSGITALIVAVNVALVDLLETRTSGRGFRLRPSSAVLLLPLVALVFGTVRMAAAEPGGRDTLRVGLVQSCIDPWISWSRNRERYLAELKEYTDSILHKDPDIIIWSESATLETISYHARRGRFTRFEKKVVDYADSIDRPLLTGEIGVRKLEGEGRSGYLPLNNAVLIHGDGRVGKTYAKIHLVPFGEWFPYKRWLPFVQDILDSFGASSFYPGEKTELFQVEGHSFGNLICYEGIFFRLTREYRRMGAEFLVNITNDGWTDTFSGHMQHFSSAVFRAVENGISFVRVGNTGYTAVIDPLGRVTHSMPILTRGAMVGEVDFSLNRETLYTRLGDLVFPAGYAIVLIFAALTFYSSWRSRP